MIYFLFFYFLSEYFTLILFQVFLPSTHLCLFALLGRVFLNEEQTSHFRKAILLNAFVGFFSTPPRNDSSVQSSNRDMKISNKILDLTIIDVFVNRPFGVQQVAKDYKKTEKHQPNLTQSPKHHAQRQGKYAPSSSDASLCSATHERYTHHHATLRYIIRPFFIDGKR